MTSSDFHRVTLKGTVIHPDNEIPPPPPGHRWKITHYRSPYLNGQVHQEYRLKLKKGWWTVDSGTFMVYGWEDDRELAMRLGAMQAAKSILARPTYRQMMEQRAEYERLAKRDLNREFRNHD